MVESLIVNNVTKTFKLSKKQMKINREKNKIKVAVNNVSFSTFNNEIFGLLGPNGAGKTTILRLIATLIKPDSGKIEIKGIDSGDDIAVKKKIGFLTNELKLEESLTPSYLFNYFSSFHKLPLDVVAKRKETLFKRFGINDFAEIKIGELSTGMRQKVSIVVSLVHDPDIIIFDEPTNGLDVITAKTVTDFLIEEKNRGKTVIISTHIMGLVSKICDRVGIILNGKMKIVDTVENVNNLVESRDLEDVFFKLYQEEENQNEVKE